MIKKKTKSVDCYEVYGEEFENEKDADKYVKQLNELLKCEHVVVSVNPRLKETTSNIKEELSWPPSEKEVIYDTIVYSVSGEHAMSKVLFILQMEFESPLIDLNYYSHNQDSFNDKLNMESVYPRYEILETKRFDTIEDMLRFFNEELVKIKYNTHNYGVIMLTNETIISEVEMKGRVGINLLK